VIVGDDVVVPGRSYRENLKSKQKTIASKQEFPLWTEEMPKVPSAALKFPPWVEAIMKIIF
jgi:hypothetical protein